MEDMWLILFVVFGLVMFVLTVLTYYDMSMLKNIIYPLSILAVIRMHLYIYNENQMMIEFYKGQNFGNRVCDGKYDDRAQSRRVTRNEKSSLIFLIHLLYFVIILLILKFMYQLFNKKMWQKVLVLVLAVVAFTLLMQFEWNNVCGGKDLNLLIKLRAMAFPLPPIILAILLILNLDRIYNKLMQESEQKLKD